MAPQFPIHKLFSKEEITERVDLLASMIARELPPNLLVVALLRGSFVFAADLIRALHRHGMTPQIDFLTASSYNEKSKPTGKVTIHQDLRESVTGRHVLLIDDILESGRTLHYAKQLLIDRGAKTIHIAVFLEKPGKLVKKIAADYVGFIVPDMYVVGYGLDYANYYRELPYIGCMEV